MSNALVTKPVTMSSRDIAELTGKEHKNVKRDIENMLDALGKDALSFKRIYRDSRNRPQTEYHLPRREVEILLTGYSIPLRAKVIDRLHELEEQAKGAAFRVPQSLPEALRLAAELAEKNEQLALENKEMAPKAVVFDNCVALRQESLATFVRTFEGMKCSLQPPNSIEVHCLHNRSQHLRPEVFTVAAEGDATGLMP